MTLTQLYRHLGLDVTEVAIPVTSVRAGYGRLTVNGTIDLPLSRYRSRVPGLRTALREEGIPITRQKFPRAGQHE